MATAVEPGSEPRTPSTTDGRAAASLFGAAYVVAAVAAVFYFLPAAWQQAVSPRLVGFGLADAGLRLLAQLAALGGLLWVGRKLLGVNPPKGVHGGIFLVISWAVAIFFIWRAVALNLNGPAAMIVSGVVAALLIVLALRNLTGSTGERWSVGLEEQGWFSTANYKRSLGQRVRRLTMLGIILIGGSGVYSLLFQGVLPANWTLAMPFEMEPVTLLTGAKYAIPVLLMGLTLWVAWRAVNVPTFGEFLIATEAEMNKVSWTPKKRLAQDTVVVLTTTVLMALFLLVVDLFWGWLLSIPQIGVLPARTPGGKTNEVQQVRW